MKRLIPLLSPLALVFMLLVPLSMNPCLPEFPEAVFTYTSHPGQPVSWYAHGNLGVLRPTYERAYLVIAHRYLQGRPLSASEVRDSLQVLKSSLEGQWQREPKETNPVQDWLSARADVLGEKGERPEILTERPSWNYVDYPNCLPDSFHTAVLTLRDRVKLAGAGSPDIREWIHGQDQVFSDCAKTRIVPAMVANDRPSWLKADRRYQQAAASLYSENFDQAAQGFNQIAQDNASPWRVIAPYLAARALIRKGMLPEGKPDEAALSSAATRLQGILKDPSRRALYAPARKMLNYVKFHLDPEKQTHELARLLSGTRADPNFFQDLIDYTRGLDRAQSEDPNFWGDSDVTEERVRAEEAQWKRQRYRELAGFRAGDAMADWIFTFQDTGQSSTDHAIRVWRKKGSLLWLVAALAKVHATDSSAADLLQAAEQVPAGFPGYTTISYHRVRLLMETGEQEEARNILDDLLPGLRRAITPSSLNMFLSQRMQLATSFDDFLSYASRSVIDFSEGSGISGEEPYCPSKGCYDRLYGGKRGQTQSRFDLDTALTLNMRMPVELLAKAALDEKLPERLRGELAVSTWARASMLGQHEVADLLVPAMRKAYPALEDSLDSYSSSKSVQEKRRSALLIILRFPGVRPYVNAGLARTTAIDKIDSYRDNWWCVDIGSFPEEANFNKEERIDSEIAKFKERAGLPSHPAFLSAEQVRAAKSEWKTLSASGTAADYLPRQALQWAQEEPDNPWIPEALHFAVRATRYGCDGSESSTLSKQAFRLLHSRYGNSKWARQTPYWY